MTVKQLYEQLNQQYPFVLQDEWDKSGIYNATYWDDEISNPILSLDVNLDVIEHAILNNSNLIISHHPIHIDENDLKKPTIKKMVKLINENKISLIALHTNFDKAKKGMNFQILKKLGCNKIKQSTKNEYIYFGQLKNKVSLQKVLENIKQKLNVEYVICNQADLDKTKAFKIGVVGGAGSSCIEDVLRKDKCDLFITGEIKWHLFNYYGCSHRTLTLIEVPHSVEKIFIETIRNTFKDIQFIEFKPTQLMVI